MIKGIAREKSTIFFFEYVYAADPAAIRFKKSEAEAASLFTKPRITNRGEKISPPPSPTIVSTKAMKNIPGIRRIDAVTSHSLLISMAANASRAIEKKTSAISCCCLPFRL
jgi:hypothetical protein